MSTVLRKRHASLMRSAAFAATALALAAGGTATAPTTAYAVACVNGSVGTLVAGNDNANTTNTACGEGLAVAGPAFLIPGFATAYGSTATATGFSQRRSVPDEATVTRWRSAATATRHSVNGGRCQCFATATGIQSTALGFQSWPQASTALGANRRDDVATGGQLLRWRKQIPGVG